MSYELWRGGSRSYRIWNTGRVDIVWPDGLVLKNSTVVPAMVRQWCDFVKTIQSGECNEYATSN